MVAALIGANAIAQQPTAAPAAAPRNPNWCSDVPASPPPPHYQAENRPNAWADTRKRCMNAVDTDWMCMDTCGTARELWQRAKAGTLNQPLTYPLSTDKLQGPFPLQGGAKGWVLPLPPYLQTRATTATPTSPKGSVDDFYRFTVGDAIATRARGEFLLTPSNRDEVPHLLFVPGAGVTPAEGSVKPTAGFTLN